MCLVVDVVENPKLRDELISRNLTPFLCANCASPTNLEKYISVVYWDLDWVAVVIPAFSHTPLSWIKKQVEYAVARSSPIRVELPKMVLHFRQLDYLIHVICGCDLHPKSHALCFSLYQKQQSSDYIISLVNAC
jgi:hypothetical protein